MFALFNKPFRIIKKGQLVNSINQKNCEVEVNFTVGKSKFKVVRGMKPTRFEIYRNNDLFNQDAAARDYQKFLEQQILKLNYKSFTQIVVLGSASFTPFMQLSGNARREIIEDLLDIKVFSTMNEVLKDKVSDSKIKINNFENDLELVKSKAEVQKNYIKKLQEDKKKKTDQLEKDIEENVLLAECLEKVILLEKRKIKDKDVVETKLTKVRTLREKLYNKKDKCAKEIKFYQDNDKCPTCDQKLNEQTKDQHIKKNENKIKEYRDALDELIIQQRPLQTRFDKIIESEELINNTYHEIHALESVVRRLRSEVKDDAIDDVDIEKERVKLKDLGKEGVSVTKKRDEKYYLDIASILLKDTGIKTKIIRQYLPVMNRIINKYLQAMDFFVSFEMDESFVESIKSRHRDDFSYASFSEGEKQRIDLALMMAWRTIAKMKNSTNTNLLILDEVFDSSLDTSGTELLHQILGTLDNNSNTFVISHRDALFDKFRSVIKFEKQNNYSRIT